MENNNIITSYLFEKAFLAVAHILVPTATFDSVETSSYIHGDFTEKTLIVRGYDVINSHNVEVATKHDSLKGLQIVVKHLDINNNVFYSFSCSYYAFNWQGLMQIETNKIAKTIYDR